jgi:conjugal transfer pilus assembly protein TraB
MATLEILEQKSQTWTGGAAALPEATRADTAYLPAGSFAEIKVISGVFATSRAGWGRDIIVSIAQPFHPPRRLHGPDRPTSPTEVDLAGCYALGTAEGDLSSARVYGTFTTLSCVLPDLTTIEQPIKAMLIGADGPLGLVGRFETRDTAYLARTFLVSLMSGAAEAFALSKRQVITTPFGGTTSVTTGSAGELAGFSALARATSDLSKFYLQQAERLLPTLWVEAGARGKIAMKEGVTLDEYPTKVLFAYGGAQ